MKSLWYAIETLSRKEDSVASVLERIKGVREIFIPTYKNLKGREQKILPRYIFILLDYNAEEIESVMSYITKIDNVLRFVSTTAIPEQEINDLRVSSSSYEGAKEVHVGSCVRITHGPFVDFRGLIEHMDKNKASVVLHILGRRTSVTVNITDIESI